MTAADKLLVQHRWQSINGKHEWMPDAPALRWIVKVKLIVPRQLLGTAISHRHAQERWRLHVLAVPAIRTVCMDTYDPAALPSSST
jgi:hypothetical protein